MKNKMFNTAKYALKFAKHDMERIGLFVEMPYVPARVKPTKKELKKLAEIAVKKAEAAAKGENNANMLPSFPKTKCGNQDGYFDEEFRRLYKGEGPGKTVKRTEKGKKAPKGNQLPFIPTGPSKKQSGSGDYYGTFSGMHEEFSPKTRKKPKFVHEPRNAQTNLARKGGPGYVDITISPYPEYIGGKPRKPPKKIKPRAGPMVTAHYTQDYFYNNPYVDPKNDPPVGRVYKPLKERKLTRKEKKMRNFFMGRDVFSPAGPGKWEGGCKAGTFNKWPDWQEDKWLSPLEKVKALELLGHIPMPKKHQDFYPHSYGFKTAFTTSVLVNTDYSVNKVTWKTYKPTYVNRLVENVY